MRRWISLVILLVAACSRSGSEATPQTTTTMPTTVPVSGVVHGELETADGRTRTHRLYLPAEREPDAPLVLALHGGSGNGDQFAASSGYDEIAEAEGFVVAYPEGTPTALGERRLVWNGGGCCAAAVRDDIDDVGYLTTLIDDLATEHDLDPTDVLVTGHSNGAIMALRLACEAADHVAAVAVQAGTVFVDDCAPSEPVSVMDLHGTADRNLPIDGGVGPESVAGVDFPPVRAGLTAIAEANGCPREAPTTTSDGLGTTIESWGPCPDGVDVDLVAVEGADHDWMDGASTLTWEFLAAHRR